MTARQWWIGLGLLLTIGVPAYAEKETDYFAVFMEGKKAGHAIHSRDARNDKVTTSDEMSITIRRLGIPVTIETRETSVETTTGKPLGFETIQQLGAMTMTVAGTVHDDGTIDLKTSSLGMEQTSTMPWPQGAVMAEGLRLLTLKKGAEPGLVYDVAIFSPGVMQAVNARVSVGEEKNVSLLGRIMKLKEMKTVLSLPGTGQVTSTSYVDKDLRALRNSIPIAGMQVEMIACSKEYALGGNEALDLIDKMFVKSPEPIEDVHSSVAIAYTLNPGDADLVIPSTDNQQARRTPDGRVVLVVRPVAAPPDATFPYRGNDPALLEAVKPTRFLQSDRREIVELAREVVGGTRSTAEALQRIESFVARHIDNKSLSVGYASAAEVLETRQGDCSEFAVLTAALCRAVGIPAQVVVGLAYVEDWAGLQGFGGHAWTQAYAGGAWVGLDAAFKSSERGGYDAGHIALATGNGEPGDFLNMASALGQFKIEKLRVQRRE